MSHPVESDSAAAHSLPQKLHPGSGSLRAHHWTAQTSTPAGPPATSLDQSQAAQQELTSELSSGVRVNSLSQDAISAGENVLLLNQIQQDDSFTLSSSMVTGKLQVADSALGSVVSQLTQAISLATAANNGTMNASNVESISNQIAGILGEVTTLANTSYQGQFIFAGGQIGRAPFTTSN